jgi:hypothetical protein
MVTDQVESKPLSASAEWMAVSDKLPAISHTCWKRASLPLSMVYSRLVAVCVHRIGLLTLLLECAQLRMAAPVSDPNSVLPEGNASALTM